MSGAEPAAGPLLRTARLELWRPQAGDLPGLVALYRPDPMRAFLTPTHGTVAGQADRLLRSAGSWQLYGYGMFIVRLPGDPCVAGVCGVFRSWRGFGQGMDDVAEAGWIIAHDHWGQGLAGEAMRAVLPWFDAEHGPQRLACMIAQGNVASQAMAAALGFAEYARQVDPGDGTVLILYERLPG